MAWAPSYVDETDVKAYVRVADTVDDAQVTLAAAAASRSVDAWTGRQFGRVAEVEARTYGTHFDYGRRQWVAEVDDLFDLDGLGVLLDGTDVTADVAWFPFNALQWGNPYTRLLLPTSGREVVVTALWGWPTVPEAVKQATLLQASRVLRRRDSPFGVAGSPDMGSELRLLARLDVDAAVILAPYRREVSF